MMTVKFKIVKKILNTLAQNTDKSYSLEEVSGIAFPLTELRNPIMNVTALRCRQAEVIEALLLLEDVGLIILNPDHCTVCWNDDAKYADYKLLF